MSRQRHRDRYVVAFLVLAFAGVSWSGCSSYSGPSEYEQQMTAKEEFVNSIVELGGIAVLFVSTIFAAATGIVGASVTILGIMAAKTMTRSGYDVRLSAGTITAGGTLGILIPPSIMLVVLGPVLEVPVTDLFAAAIIPGLMLAFMYAA